MKKHIFYRLTCIFILAGLISGCAGTATSTQMPTATPQSSATPKLTDTPLPSATATTFTATIFPTTTPTLTSSPNLSPNPESIDPKLLSDLEEMIANEGESGTIDLVIRRIEENPSGVVAYILPKLTDNNQSEIALVIYSWALGWTKDKTAIDPLFELAKKTDSDWVYANCINSLVSIGGEQAGEKLSLFFEETTDPDQQYMILNGLAKMQYEPALPLMERILEVDPKTEYWKPLFVFGKMGDSGVPYLLGKIEDDNLNIRTNAIILLTFLIAPEAAQPLRERYWVEENPRIRSLILSALEWITPDLELIRSFSEEVIEKEKDETLVQFAQETIDNLPQMREEIDSFISKKGISQQDFQIEYDRLYESYGGDGDMQVLARASTVEDEVRLKKLRERFLQRDSDEALYDYDEVNQIISLNRQAQVISEREGKPWSTWPTATPAPTAPPPFGSSYFPSPSRSAYGSWDSWDSHLVFSPDGKQIAVNCPDWIEILDATTLGQTYLLEKPEDSEYISSLAFNTDGSQLAIAHSSGLGVKATSTLSILDIYTSQAKLWASEPLTWGSEYLEYSSDGRFIGWSASAHLEGTVDVLRLFDAGSGELLENQPDLPALDILSAAFNLDGNLLGICCSQSAVILWDTQAGKVAGTIQNGGSVETLLFALTGSSLMGYDSTTHQVHVWDLKTLKPSQPAVELTDYPANYEYGIFRFSPDARFLAATFSIDTGLRSIFAVYDVQTGKSLGSMDCEGSCSSAAFSPDGENLAVINGQELLVWDMDSITE